MPKRLISAPSKDGNEWLECRQRESGGVVILDLKGKLGRDETGDELHALLRRLVRAGKTRVVLNLRHLGPLDAPALCALLVDLVRLRQGGGDLRLLHVEPRNMGFLLRTGTNVAFLIFTSERDAVAGFSPNEAFEPSARIAAAA